MATTCMDPRIRRKPIRSMLVNWVPRKIHVSRALDTGSTVTKKTRLHASEDADAETVYCKWDEGAHNGYRK